MSATADESPALSRSSRPASAASAPLSTPRPDNAASHIQGKLTSGADVWIGSKDLPPGPKNRTRPTTAENGYGQPWGGSCSLDPPLPISAKQDRHPRPNRERKRGEAKGRF